MQGSQADLNVLLFQMGSERLWLQETPIMPGVWRAFAEDPGELVDVIITPHHGVRPGRLAEIVRARLTASGKGDVAAADIAFNQTAVVARVSFEQVARVLVPLSSWYRRAVASHLDEIGEYISLTTRSMRLRSLLEALRDPTHECEELEPRLVWWLRLTGTIAALRGDDSADDPRTVLNRGFELLSVADPDQPPVLFRIGVNRSTEHACLDSIRTIKADVVDHAFESNASEVCWAVLDSGIDSTHPAFLDADGEASRVVETWDFTRVRRLVNLASTPGDAAERELREEFALTPEEARRIRTALGNGGDVDWEALKPALRVDEGELEKYVRGLHPHGTHVAGIIGGRAQDGVGENQEESFRGVCPTIRLIDVRILDSAGSSGRRDSRDREFEVLAALQFIAHRNSIGDRPRIHGVNLSIQLLHDPAEFACGATPVCQDCDRLVANGVVVVVAAGNKGIESGSSSATTFEGSFRAISISDPGNAAAVITVGSTHRKRPHEYGVSYFSGRGPTGDGRAKPDLVAPGERILGPVPGGGYAEMSGTSQAAPHVSGAAALLLARHGELVGNAARVKQVLCQSATDLGRCGEYQGAGLVDILRALQAI